MKDDQKNFLLFAVLAALMVVTRRIDWYALLARMRAEGGGEPTIGREGVQQA